VKRIKRIVLEYNADEALMMALGISKKEIQHQPNKGAVCNYQKKEAIPIAIIDEDPGAGQPKILSDFSTKTTQHGVRLLIHRNLNQKIIVIQPFLENWLIDRCSSAKIDPQEYGLPNSGKGLHKVVNNRLEQFKRLIKALLHAKDPGLLALKEIIDLPQY